MATDLATWNLIFQQAADEVIKEVGAAWGSEKEVAFFKAWVAKVRAKATANSYSGL